MTNDHGKQLDLIQYGLNGITKDWKERLLPIAGIEKAVKDMLNRISPSIQLVEFVARPNPINDLYRITISTNRGVFTAKLPDLPPQSIKLNGVREGFRQYIYDKLMGHLSETNKLLDADKITEVIDIVEDKFTEGLKELLSDAITYSTINEGDDE
jgi:hypothetical protein